MTPILGRSCKFLSAFYQRLDAGIEKWINPTNRPSLKLVIGTLIAFAMSVGSIEAALNMAAADSKGPTLLMVVIIFTWLGSFLVSLSFVIQTTLKTWHSTNLPKNDHLRLIMTSYLSLIIAFAGIYYSMESMAEYNDAVGKYYYYRAGIYAPFHIKTQRAFGGMSHQRWRDIEYHVLKERYLDLQAAEPAEIPVADLIKKARESDDFRADGDLYGGLMVLVDCFHFSTATMTTLGYGDITPKQWYSKLAADLEVLTGIFIAAVSIGSFFSRKEEPSEERVF